VSQVSPKVRLAGTAAITLLLGLGLGSILSPWRPDQVPQVQVKGAQSLDITCGTLHVQDKSGGPLPLPEGQSCVIEAKLEDGRTIRGTVDALRPGRYRCQNQQGGLACAAP